MRGRSIYKTDRERERRRRIPLSSFFTAVLVLLLLYPQNARSQYISSFSNAQLSNSPQLEERRESERTFLRSY